MVSQIIKKDIPTNIIYEFLDKICDNNVNENIIDQKKYFTINKSSFRKAEFHNLIIPFLEVIKQYYHLSKQFYITRKLTYNNFLTIIRQICNFKNISYESKITYQKSNYEVIYYIFF